MKRHGDHLEFTFGNGLSLRTDLLYRNDVHRVIPLGRACMILMKYMLNNPQLVKSKKVCEPFAGAGPMGFYALKLGARHCTFIDINTRAIEFIEANALANGFDKKAYEAVKADIKDLVPRRRFDILFANRTGSAFSWRGTSFEWWSQRR